MLGNIFIACVPIVRDYVKGFCDDVHIRVAFVYFVQLMS